MVKSMVEKINRAKLTVLIMFIEFWRRIRIFESTLYLMNIMIPVEKINRKLCKQQTTD